MASFLTLPRELRHEILGLTFDSILRLDLAYNLRFRHDAELHHIVEREMPRMGKLSPRINQQAKILKTAYPELTEDCDYMLDKARHSVLSQYDLVMEVWDSIQSQAENKLTLLNIGFYVKDEGVPTTADAIPKIKERFRISHP